MEKTDKKPLGIAEMLGHVALTHSYEGSVRETSSGNKEIIPSNDSYSKLYMLAFHKKQLEQALKLTVYENGYLENRKTDISAHYKELISQIEETERSVIREIEALEDQIRTVENQKVLTEQLTKLSKEQSSKFSLKKIFKQETTSNDATEQLKDTLTDQIKQFELKIKQAKAKIADLQKEKKQIEDKTNEEKEALEQKIRETSKESQEIEENIASVIEKIDEEKLEISGTSDMTLFLANDINIE